MAKTARAARVRRILSRAGLVLGGAVVGTAAAWLLSSASASADTDTTDVLQPVVGALTQHTDTKPSELPQYVDQIVHKAPAPPQEITEVGRQVQDTVEQVAGQLRLPAAPTHRAEDTSPALRLLSLGNHDISPIVRPVDALSQTASALTTQTRPAAHDYSRHPVSESPRHEPSPAPAPGLPALPPAPLVPPTAPAGSCSNSCGHGSDDDLGMPFVDSWPAPQSGLGSSRALRLVSQHVVTAVGAQPGVTPD
ncbi:hypothetical protein [Actinocrispum sp. NPDC049592]|uniref:hypothetical protein n=1 Tax=Actinocrispum sp. NPDC049592 TaxID=3154835 RepID=UPI00341D9882